MHHYVGILHLMPVIITAPTLTAAHKHVPFFHL